MRRRAMDIFEKVTRNIRENIPLNPPSKGEFGFPTWENMLPFPLFQSGEGAGGWGYFDKLSNRYFDTLRQAQCKGSVTGRAYAQNLLGLAAVRGKDFFPPVRDRNDIYGGGWDLLCWGLLHSFVARNDEYGRERV